MIYSYPIGLKETTKRRKGRREGKKKGRRKEVWSKEKREYK